MRVGGEATVRVGGEATVRVGGEATVRITTYSPCTRTNAKGWWGGLGLSCALPAHEAGRALVGRLGLRLSPALLVHKPGLGVHLRVSDLMG